MASAYRAGIIGLGWIGCGAPDSHMGAYLDNPKIHLIAVCDKKYGRFPVVIPKDMPMEEEITIPAYSDYNEMLRENNLDIISVCTPVETHCEIVCDIAPYVKAIWCEKPIATTLGDAVKMLETCAKHGTILVVNHQRNYTNPRFKFSGGKLNTGTHALALIDHLFKPEIKVDVEYIDTNERIFELDCLHTEERMLPNVLGFIVEKLDREEQFVDYNAYRALERCLEL